MPYWDKIRQIIAESDVVLEIVDARLVESSRNEELEKIIKQSGRPSILVLNKSDLVSKRQIELSVDELRRQGKIDVVFVSNRNKKTVKNLLGKIKRVFDKYGKRKKIEYEKKKSSHREAKADIVIGVVGYPNVGKSSVINALSFKKKAKVTSKAGTTHGAHWIAATDQIKFIDSPGVIPMKYMDRTKLDMIGARGVEKIKDKEVVAAKIIDMFLEKDKKIFEKKYNFKIKEGRNSYEILEDLGFAKGHLKKGGVVDDTRVSIMVIKDWQQGKLKL